jgi:hypothetical protein
MNQNYYNKYLKYRSKYLQLKKTKMNGGANCPKIGYFQHYGECWHDALSIALLYSDTLSEFHQKIFDDPAFNASNIVRRDPATFKEHLMPINIESENYDFFLNWSEYYLNSLQERYINDKQPITKPPIKLEPFSLANKEIYVNIVKKPPALIRQESLEMSLDCVYSIFNISNINNINPSEYTDKKHSGYSIQFYTIISTINYFLTSYKENKYIEINEIVIKGMIEGTKRNIRGKLINLMKCIQNSHAIILQLKSDVISEGHILALITCDKKHYLYDDNGISDSNYKRIIEFNWKDELVNRIDGIIELLKDKSEEEIIEKLQTLFSTSNPDFLNFVFSDFFNGKINILDKIYNKEDKIGSIGKAYLKSFYIYSMLFLKLEDIPTSIGIKNQLKMIYEGPLIFDFNNKKTIDFIKYYLSILEYNEIFQLFIESLTANNYDTTDIIFNYIINNFRKGINIQTTSYENLLFAFLFLDQNDKINYNNLELKKYYIREIINRNIKFTTKDYFGMDILTKIKKTPKLNNSPYIKEIANTITSEIINKILRDTPSLAQFYSILNHPFFKNVTIDKIDLVRKYKQIHKIK